MPPMFAGGKSSTRGGANVNDNQVYGQLLTLQPNAQTVNPAAGIGTTRSFFALGEGCYLDVIGLTNASSGEISVRVSPTDSASPTFFAPLLTTLSTSMQLESATFAARSQRLGPMPRGGRAWMQVEIAGTDPTKLTDIVAARFVSAVDDRGLTVSAVSAGGYRINSILLSHGQCFEALSAMDPDVVFIAYGANEPGNFHTPEVSRSHLEALIARLRTSLGTAIPVVLLSDPARGGLNNQQRAWYDQLAGVNYQIALDDPFVCALNGRRLTEEAGWSLSTLATYTDAQQVHYSPAGSILKARVEIQALLAAFAPCVADFNRDGFVDFFDYDDYVTCFEGGLCGNGKSDVNWDGFTDFFDYDEFVDQFMAGCDD